MNLEPPFFNTSVSPDFLGQPTTGTGLDMPSQTHRARGGLTAGSCGPFFLAAIALRVPSPPGSATFTGEGRLWTMCCRPLTSIVAYMPDIPDRAAVHGGIFFAIPM